MASGSELGLRDGDFSKVGRLGNFCVRQQLEICFVNQDSPRTLDGNTLCFAGSREVTGNRNLAPWPKRRGRRGNFLHFSSAELR